MTLAHELDPALSRATGKHCAALLLLTFSDLVTKGGAESIFDQGTITFVKVGENVYGITNEHVANPEGAPTDHIFHIALAHHVPLPEPPLFMSTPANPDFPYDLAIFKINPDVLVRAGKVPITLPDAPSIHLREEDTALAVGFPGYRRRIEKEHTVHEMAHVVSTCRLSSDRSIMLTDALDDLSLDLRFGGLSGGPIFALVGAQEYEFVGIIFDGRGPGDFEEDINQAGSPINKEEIWVRGFPLTRDTLQRILERGA